MRAWGRGRESRSENRREGEKRERHSERTGERERECGWENENTREKMSKRD